jgi:arginine exporter protein ArgO
MTDLQRLQGGAICLGAALTALLFLIGLLGGSYLALAIPVAALVFSILGLTFWVGWTIMRVRLEPEADLEASGEPSPDGSSADG